MDPTQFRPMAHQVGGHATTKTSLRAHGGQILKPFQSKQRGEREHAFYEDIFQSPDKQGPAIYRDLRKLLPAYRGLVVVSDDDASGGNTPQALHPGKYLALEDLTYGRTWPCIMDVKVGTRSYEDGASAEKIAYEKSKFPLQTEVGFRVQGIKVYDPALEAYAEFDKHVGRGITTRDELGPLFAKYLPQDRNRAAAILKAFLARLDAFRRWFESQTEFEFIASSLLFLYDGEGQVDDASADIRLIDFAHVQHCAQSQRDEGVLLGITTIIACFDALLQEL